MKNSIYLSALCVAFLWFAFAQGTNLAQGQEELDSLSLEVSGPLGVEPFVLFYSDSKGEAVNRFLKGNEEDFSFSEFEIVESSSLKERSAKTLIDLVKGDDNDVQFTKLGDWNIILNIEFTPPSSSFNVRFHKQKIIRGVPDGFFFDMDDEEWQQKYSSVKSSLSAQGFQAIASLLSKAQSPAQKWTPKKSLIVVYRVQDIPYGKPDLKFEMDWPDTIDLKQLAFETKYQPGHSMHPVGFVDLGGRYQGRYQVCTFYQQGKLVSDLGIRQATDKTKVPGTKKETGKAKTESKPPE